MLQLTRKTDYALVALTHLAQRAQEDAGPTSARLIAEAYKLPLPLLMNILKELAQAKLVSSTRGATGGYALAVEPSRVSLLEVINAIEGPVKLAACCDGLPIVGQGCGMEDCCPIQGSINKLHQRMIDFFGGVTLDELMDESCGTSAPATPASSAPQACSTHGQPVKPPVTAGASKTSATPDTKTKNKPKRKVTA